MGRESLDRELQGVFLDPSLLTENLKWKANRDSSTRERRLLQGRIHSWQQELGMERGVLGDEGLRTELRQVIGTLQIEDHKMEEIPLENRRLLEERDTPMLKLSMTMRQMEGSRTSSMAGGKSCTPIPQGAGGGLQRAAVDHFDPHAEEGTKEGKRALSLRGLARKALETASLWALSLLGVAWKVLETASSWSKAQGTLARVLRASRNGEKYQIREEPGQREREAAKKLLLLVSSESALKALNAGTLLSLGA